MPPVEVMNTILAAVLEPHQHELAGSALAYTYGAGSFFSYHRSPGPFIVFSDVRTDVTAPATSEVFNELKRMRDTQMTPTELLLSKDSIARSLPGGSSAGTEAAGAFAELFTYDLPLNYFSTLPERINAVTTEQAQSVAKEVYFAGEDDRCCGGRPRKDRRGHEEAEFGKVEIRIRDGRLWALNGNDVRGVRGSVAGRDNHGTRVSSAIRLRRTWSSIVCLASFAK